MVNNTKVLIATLILLVTCFIPHACNAIGWVPATTGQTYYVNRTNTQELKSPEYEFVNVFGPGEEMDFDELQLYFQSKSEQTEYAFTLSLISGRYITSASAIFGTLKLSVNLLNNMPVDKVMFRFNAPQGIINVDLLRHMKAYFFDPSSITYELNPIKDLYGGIDRYCNMFEVTLNLDAIFKAIGKTEFQLVVYSLDSPYDPTPMVDYRWIEVAYPSTFAMKIESDPTFSRFFTVGFPNQPPVNYFYNDPAKFIMTEVNNVRMQDIIDPRTYNKQTTILKSYLFRSDRLITAGSFYQYNYNYNDLKDIYGDDVEIKFDEVYCGSTLGQGYSFGVPIYPQNGTYEVYGTVVCPASGMVPNSLVIIYATVVLFKKPRIDVLTNGEEFISEVSNGFGKYMRTGKIEKDTCVTFKGNVYGSELAIYMIQQQYTRLIILPSFYGGYTQMVTLAVGKNRQATFCSNQTIYNQVGAFEQEMDFLFISPDTSMASEFEMIGIIGNSVNTAPIVVGILVTVTIVLTIIVLGVVGFYLYKRRIRSKNSYDSINN